VHVILDHLQKLARHLIEGGQRRIVIIGGRIHLEVVDEYVGMPTH
jgi:DNA-binding LacI/PurR family transcriptional regulator